MNKLIAATFLAGTLMGAGAASAMPLTAVAPGGPNGGCRGDGR